MPDQNTVTVTEVNKSFTKQYAKDTSTNSKNLKHSYVENSDI